MSTDAGRRGAVTPLWIESVGPCWGTLLGVATLVDDEGRSRLMLHVGPAELSTLVAAASRASQAGRRVVDDGRILGVHLVARPDGGPTGLVVAVDGLGRRARGCRAAEALGCAAEAGLPLWVADDLLARWGTPFDQVRHAPRPTFPPAFHRLIAEELPTLDAL